MYTEKRKKLSEKLKTSINGSIATNGAFMTIISSASLSIVYFSLIDDNIPLEIYKITCRILCLFIIIIAGIRFFPRRFDDRELELYEQYHENHKTLKKQIKKEKLEEKIKNLEEKKSRI